ncbi:MAG: RNA-dependent RNA polymerase [Guiyang chuvirus 1]|nr:MAG: RNA-dependent RNA polymerase [Guiyang chuvirus 1]
MLIEDPDKFNNGLPRAHSKQTAGELKVDEKFDTWLDVEGIGKWLEESRATNKIAPPEIIDNWRYPKRVFKNQLRAAGITKLDIAGGGLSPYLPALMIRYLTYNRPQYCGLSPREWREMNDCIFDATQISCEIQLKHILESFSPDLNRNHSDSVGWINEKLKKCPDSVKSLFRVRLDMFRLLNAYKTCTGDKVFDNSEDGRKEIVHGYIVCCESLGNVRFHMTGVLHMCEFADQKIFLTHQMLLEIINKLIEFANVSLYYWACSGNSCPSNMLAIYWSWVRSITSIFLKHNRIAMTTAEALEMKEPFCFLKAVEALGVSQLIRRNDMITNWDNTKLQEVTWAALHQDGIVTEDRFEDHPFGKLLSAIPDEAITELMGISKVFGHPFINVDKGLEELYCRVRAPLNINPEIILCMENQLKKDLFFGYRRNKKKFPNFTLDKRCNHRLRKILNQNLDPSRGLPNITWKEIPMESWSYVEILPTEEFEIVENQLTLLKDKALGLPRSNVMLQLARDCQSTSRPASQISESKALLAYLLDPHFDKKFLDYLNQFIGNDAEDWPHLVRQYLVIKLTPKELEFKDKGRMFGASPGVERARRQNAELACMKVLDKYFPDQLMTPDELTAIKRLYSFRALRRLHPKQPVLQVSFDFSKFNNNMRHESIDQIAGNVLDKFFGTPLWSKTMEAFKRMLVYFLDRHRSRYWKGQEGGIEGLNQATWSLIFLAGIKYALGSTTKVYQVTVKGDDVRAAIVLPVEGENITPSYLERQRDLILQKMQELCKEVGWQLNPQECFVSMSLIATSKQYQINESWLPSASKKMLKIESLSNVLFPSLEDIVANIYSNCHSACSQTTVILPSFLVATLVAARVIYQEYAYNNVILNKFELACLLMWPQILGGPGSLPLQVFYVRGENDMLSVSLSLFRYIMVNYHNKLPRLVSCILRTPLKKPLPFNLLVSDPYGLPLDLPDRPNQLLKRCLKDSLKRWVRNRRILPVISTKMERDSQRFLELLISMQPYCAKIATALWESSVFYLKEELLSKFAVSSTVFHYLSSGAHGYVNPRQGYRTLQKLVAQAQKRQDYWIAVLRGSVYRTHSLLGLEETIWFDPKICTTEIVHRVREICWQREIIGLTYPSMVDQFKLISPKDYHLFGDGFIQLANAKHEIRVKEICPQTHLDPSHHYASVQGVVPWLGSKTLPSATIKGFEGQLVSPAVGKLKKIIVIAQNCHILGDDLKKVCQTAISALININLNDVLVIAAVEGGGHIAHRVPINAFSLITMPNFRPNRGQLVHHMMDQLQFVESDGHRRTVNYACYRYWITMLMTFDLETRRELKYSDNVVLRSALHWDLTKENNYSLCPWCNNIVDDPIIKFDLSLCDDLSKYQQVHMLGCSEIEEQIVKQNILSAVSEGIKLSIKHLDIDINDPLTIQAASHVYLHNLTQRGYLISSIKQQMGARFIHDQDLLPALAAMSGDTRLVFNEMTDLIMRTIPSRVIYTSIRDHVFYLLAPEIMRYMAAYSSSGLLNQGLITAKTYAIFERVIGSGSCESLIRGSRESYIEEPSASHDSVYLTLTVANSTDPKSLAKKFITEHLPIYIRWLEEPQKPCSFRPFIHYDDSDTIITKLSDIYQTFLRVAGGKLSWGYHRRGLFRELLSRIDEVKNSVRLTISPEEIIETAEAITERGLSEILDPKILTVISYFLPRPQSPDDDITRLPNWAIFLRCWVFFNLHVYFPLQVGDDLEFLYDKTVNDLQIINSDPCNLLGSSHIPINTAADHFEYIAMIRDDLQEENFLLVSSWVTVIALASLVDEDSPWITTYDLEVEIRKILDTLASPIRLFHNIRITTISSLEMKRVLKDKGDLAAKCAELLASIREDQVWKNNNALRLNPESWCDNASHTRRYIDPRALTTAGTGTSRRSKQVFVEAISNLRDEVRQSNTVIFTPDCMYFVIGTVNFSAGRFLFRSAGYQFWRNLQRLEDRFVLISIGDGTGSITQLLALQSTHIKVIFSSLQSKGPDEKKGLDCPHLQLPLSLILDNLDLSNRVVWNGLYPGDIHDPENVASINKLVSEMAGGVNMVLFDAEFGYKPSEIYIRECYVNLFKIILENANRTTICIIKVDMRNPDIAHDISQICALIFADVHLVAGRVASKIISYCHLACSGLSSSATIDRVSHWILFPDDIPFFNESNNHVTRMMADYIDNIRRTLDPQADTNLMIFLDTKLMMDIFSPLCDLNILLDRMLRNSYRVSGCISDVMITLLNICRDYKLVTEAMFNIGEHLNTEFGPKELLSIPELCRCWIFVSTLSRYLDWVNSGVGCDIRLVIWDAVINSLMEFIHKFIITRSRRPIIWLSFMEGEWFIMLSADRDNSTAPSYTRYQSLTGIMLECHNIVFRIYWWMLRLCRHYFTTSNDEKNKLLVPKKYHESQEGTEKPIGKFLESSYNMSRLLHVGLDITLHLVLHVSHPHSDEDIRLDTYRQNFQDWRKLVVETWCNRITLPMHRAYWDPNRSTVMSPPVYGHLEGLLPNMTVDDITDVIRQEICSMNNCMG